MSQLNSHFQALGLGLGFWILALPSTPADLLRGGAAAGVVAVAGALAGGQALEARQLRRVGAALQQKFRVQTFESNKQDRISSWKTARGFWSWNMVVLRFVAGPRQMTRD